MSGILERMLKRARGERGGVQPRIAPRFAPAARESREMAEGANVRLASRMRPDLEMNEENSAAAPGIETGAVSRTTGDSADTLRRTTQTRRRSGNDAEAASRDVRWMAGERSGVPRARFSNASADKREETGSIGEQQAHKPPEGGETPHASDEGSGLRPVLVKPLAANVGGAEAEVVPASSLFEPRTDSAQEESTRKMRKETTQAIGALAQREVKKDSGSGPDENEAPREEKTEIHISIGNVELHSPRVEARPQAVPFRPRVTLGDFLRRPEARR